VTFTYYLGLGTNLGDRFANLVAALARLATEGEAVTVSSIYESEPVGGPEQDQFLNMVCVVRADKEPMEMLGIVKAIEVDLGREPGERWGPRVIDIDILAAGLLRVKTPELEIPHAELTNRLFASLPLAEVHPLFEPPGTELQISAIATMLLGSAEVTKWRPREELLQDLPEGVWAGSL
jgi:2-amino-4-hydroxy-6-hydroxymethyldihydropteridine diphosphokinase